MMTTHDASLGVGHIWTAVQCPAYQSLKPADCTCNGISIAARLEELRAELRAEQISMGELIELEGLAEYIEPDDIELLEAAGVPEFEPDIWEMLEADAPDGCEDVQSLYSWSLNYDAGKGPFALFLDLIGWTADELGEGQTVCRLEETTFGYLELSKLAEALTAYSDRPTDVRNYVNELMAAESRG